MDEMRIVSKFTRGIISKAIKMVIRKKTGYNIDIQLNEAITTVNDGKTHLHLDVDAELDKDELMSILKSVGLNYFAKFTRHIMRDSSSVGRARDDQSPEVDGSSPSCFSFIFCKKERADVYRTT